MKPDPIQVKPDPTPTMAEQIAQAATAYQRLRTGHEPKSVNVVLSGDTLVVTLHGALSPAEQAMVASPGAVVQVFTSGTMVQVFLLSGKVPSGSFNV